MTPEELSALAGIIFSLLISYVPGFYRWFQKLDLNPKDSELDGNNKKRMFILVILFLITFAISLISCTNLSKYIIVNVSCEAESIKELIRSFITAVIANQITYQISPKLNWNHRKVV